MICTTPETIKTPEHLIPKFGTRYIQVPCRKCTACLKRRAAQWLFRLKQEERRSISASFMTYTYDDSYLPRSQNGYPTLFSKDHTDYMKRLRTQLKREGYETALKYYACGEYGSQTQRPHYHSILYNLPIDYISNPERIQKLWGNGIISCDSVTTGSIAYVCGYVDKQTFMDNRVQNDDRRPEFNVQSKGIGDNWLTEKRVKKMKTELNPLTRNEEGHPVPIPRYYRDKALTPAEKFIMGQKAMQYAVDNPTFHDEIHRRNYVEMDSFQRMRRNKTKRGKNG